MSPLPFSPEDKVLLDEVAGLTVKAARPLIWHDASLPWPKRLSGGTCFILRFDNGLIGVTAEHVVQAFEDSKMLHPSNICLLRTVPLDLVSAIVDRDAELDIATFRITEDQLRMSEAMVIDCRSPGWPPPTPDRGRELSLAGFPEALKEVSPHHLVKFKAFAYLARVEDVGTRDIIVSYDPRRDGRMRAAPELPDLGANLSGCSGGPVLMHVERKGIHRWFPVGLIVAGPGDLPDGMRRQFDLLRIKRVNYVNRDGTIRRKQESGWLPA